MATINVSLPSDGETIDASDYNTPITTIVNTINGGLDNDNIASGAAITGSKIADNSLDIGAKASTWDGWIEVSDSWTYASGATTNVGTITVPTDATTKYSVGMKLKFSQTTVKYAIITKVEATTLTIYMGTDYTIANAAISAISVSNVKAPFGFPLDPAKWSIVATSTSSSSQSSPVTGTLYNLGGSIAIPIGVWRVSYFAHLLHASSSTAYLQSFAGLGTTSSSVIDATLCSSPVVSAAMTEVNGPVSSSNLVTLASPTTYYLNARRNIGSGGSIQIRGDLRTTILSAECAYL